MTALTWQRPIANGTGKKYHLTHAGTPLCGTRITTGLTYPRELTERQIASQGCGKCVKRHEGETSMSANWFTATGLFATSHGWVDGRCALCGKREDGTEGTETCPANRSRGEERA